MRVDSWLGRAAAAHPGRAAVNELTYAELLRAASAGASALAHVSPGQRVAIALDPGADFAVALHAIWLRGAIAVPHDLRLRDSERPQADHLIDAPLPRDGAASAPPQLDLGAVAVLLQTSGTTGPGKEVRISFGNLLWSALGSAAALGSSPAERWLCALPLSHVGGLSILVRAAISGTTALVHPKWDTERALAALRSDDVTMVSVVPTTLARLLDAGLQASPALRCALVGGAPVPPELLARAADAGIPVAQTYGLTEACSQVTTQRPGDVQPDAGPPLFCTRVRLAGDGEVLVSGPTIANGGGELATGDLGVLDDAGRLTVIGRKADTIVSGGENVAPSEVEAVLLEHPSVAEAAVHGRADPEWGEAVVAAVVLRAGAEFDPEALIEHCATRLARFKTPKEVRKVDGLPRTSSGKLLRNRL